MMRFVGIKKIYLNKYFNADLELLHQQLCKKYFNLKQQIITYTNWDKYFKRNYLRILLLLKNYFSKYINIQNNNITLRAFVYKI